MTCHGLSSIEPVRAQFSDNTRCLVIVGRRGPRNRRGPANGSYLHAHRPGPCSTWRSDMKRGSNPALPTVVPTARPNAQGRLDSVHESRHSESEPSPPSFNAKPRIKSPPPFSLIISHPEPAVSNRIESPGARTIAGDGQPHLAAGAAQPAPGRHRPPQGLQRSATTFPIIGLSPPKFPSATPFSGRVAAPLFDSQVGGSRWKGEYRS